MFLSLAVNLLLVGLIIGAVAAGARLRRDAPGGAFSRADFAQIMETLPEESRRVVRRAVVRGWFQSRDNRNEAGRLRREAFEIAAAEPYDAERVRAAFARMREADAATTGVYHDRIADALGELTPDQRRAALEAIRQAARARRTPSLAPDAAPTPAEHEAAAPSAP
jgi:uncharacterized membrane protein